jgi:MFS family permease
MIRRIKTNISSIPSGVFAISFANFLMNISTSLVFGLSTCYMKQCLNMTTGNVAFLQNFVDSLSFLFKMFSGVLSDFIRRRKAIVILGFLCISVAKPMLAIATTPVLVLIARMFDRMGNGIQAVPRDALVGDLSDKTNRGQCFGMKNTLATFGSLLGGMLGYGLMRLTNDNYSLTFLAGTIPCTMAIMIFVMGVNDPLHEKTAEKKKNSYTFLWATRNLGKDFWKLMLVMFLFMCSRFGESTLVLNAMETQNISPASTSLIIVLYNATYSLISYPIGFLSDRIGRKKLLLCGFLVMTFSQLCLGLSAVSLPFMYLGILLWGGQLGITNSISYALTNDYIPMNELRGTALSILNLLSAIATILAGGVFRIMSNEYSIKMAFGFGLTMSASAFILGALLIKERYRRGTV